ncbi:MAG: DUF4959 domain-containing protein [Tannerella sp.]|jgi:hypothetical protein|nr:DUF4959 domain-containing protein [Tannerella sp.]
MNKIYYAVILFLTFGITSCEEKTIGQTPTNSTPPQPVANVAVESMPGGARISYDLPEETDISYVKGEYLFQGRKRVVRASIYNNYMIVEGLGSTEPLEITLYTVDHSENASSPVKTTFTPGTPPIWSILESVRLLEDFGGVNVKWNNDTGTEIGITIFAEDENSVMEEGETLFTNQKEGDYSFRGYDTASRTFAVTVTDKWGNISDTVKGVFSPYFEKQLDKSRHRRHVLPVDNNTDYSSAWIFMNMFDDIVGGQGWHTRANDPNQKIPIYFTIDLGVEAKLSRFKLWHRIGGVQYYAHYNVRTFEVWGTNEYKAGMMEDYWSEEWKSDWEMLGDFYTFKPSGENSPVTDEDRAYADAGFEFLIPVEKKGLRYVRFAMKSNWSGSNTLNISELTFWGDDGTNN